MAICPISFADLEPGTTIGSTHGGIFDWEGKQRDLEIREKHEIKSVVQVNAFNPADVVTAMLLARKARCHLATNKDIVVLETTAKCDFNKKTRAGKIVAAYYHDSSHFGMVEIAVELPYPYEA